MDYARRLIFTESTISRWRVRSHRDLSTAETYRFFFLEKPEDLRQGLVDALRRGYIDFIELFIEYGVTLDMLTAGDIEYLYTTASVGCRSDETAVRCVRALDRQDIAIEKHRNQRSDARSVLRGLHEESISRKSKASERASRPMHCA